VRELRWLGRLLIPGLFDGEHSLRLEPTLDATLASLKRKTQRHSRSAVQRRAGQHRDGLWADEPGAQGPRWRRAGGSAV